MIPKFRAWLKKEQRMIKVCELTYIDDELRTVSDENRDFYTDDEFKLMQSTGLVDWEGVEVYEGDIVKIPDDYEVFGKNAGETCKVIFDSGCFRLKTLCGRGRGFWFEDDSTVTIIGNIYENPELLGE